MYYFNHWAWPSITVFLLTINRRIMRRYVILTKGVLMKKLWILSLIILFSSSVLANDLKIDLDRLAKLYFNKMVATQSPSATKKELEEYLDIDVGALVEDTSSWTEADWAEQWTGDPATHKNVNGERIELTAEEQQKIHAEWAKNRAEQYGN